MPNPRMPGSSKGNVWAALFAWNLEAALQGKL